MMTLSQLLREIHTELALACYHIDGAGNTSNYEVGRTKLSAISDMLFAARRQVDESESQTAAERRAFPNC